MIRNPFILLVGLMQMGAGIYSLHLGDWRFGLINIFVGIANCVFSTALEG